MAQVIGKTLTNGFAGMYSRQPDSIIDTRFAGGTVPFGAPVKYSTGKVVTIGAGDAATAFLGIAVAEVKTSNASGIGEYATNEPVPVMKRGRVNVKCNVGTPAANGAVYVRIATNISIPDGVVGGIEAASDTTNTIQLTNAKFAGAKDANGIVELEIIEPINV